MQSPPPVSDLLKRLETMIASVGRSLSSTDIDWEWSPSADEWSLTEVLCHLRDVEKEVHQDRFRRMINSENAFMPGVSADEWAGPRHYRTQDGRRALEEFLTARKETLAMLEELETDMWERQGRHAFFGPTTMHELLFLVARHDEIHRQQIQSLVAGHKNADC